MNDRVEIYVGICSHIQVALKALQAAITMSPLVQFPPTILWDSSGFPNILGEVEMKLLMGSQWRELSTHLLDPNLLWGSLGS
jgi:hypothetical protein